MKCFNLKIIAGLVTILFVSCQTEKSRTLPAKPSSQKISSDTVIRDCNYTFEEAIAGTKAPKEIIDQLELISVCYYSTDGRIHQGQILTNRKLVAKIRTIFRFMYKVKFPVAHAIPAVKYNWDDELSMQANNTYSFCYRNVEYSKHACGMAIDINPFFNPLRWKMGYTHKKDVPEGASYNPQRAGTFHAGHSVVQRFRELGFRWGHTFSRKFDDHHFEL